MRLTTSRGDHYGESIPAILRKVFGVHALLVTGPEDTAAYVADACGYGIQADVYGCDQPEAIRDELARRNF
jgi:hypothetical protein